jgi:hypothetical protein
MNQPPAAAVPPGPAPAPAASRTRTPTYRQLLTWAFTLFSSVRVLSYLPTLWAICASGDSSQHSLWTWGTWLGSNLTMALWLHEQHGQSWTRAAVVNLTNAAMCAATFTVILVFRA